MQSSPLPVPSPSPGFPCVPIGVRCYYGFSPIFGVFPNISETSSDRQNGFQIRVLHQKILNIKEKRVIFYLPLKP